MSRPNSPDAVRQLFIALWGLGTLILLFTVILLIGQLMKDGRDPLDMVRPRNTESANAAATARNAVSMGKRAVRLYFADGEGRALVSEEREIESSDSTQENCRRALDALMAGPQSGGTPIFPAAVQLRALYLLDSGELVLDFSRELIAAGGRFKSASFEALLVYGVVNTLCQPPLQAKGGTPVRQVRFLFEGAPPQEGFPAHLDLSAALQPDTSWVAAP